jgi:hypothetical protein
LFDHEFSVKYSWKGGVENNEARALLIRLVEVDVEHRTSRMCWGAGKGRRDYMQGNIKGGIEPHVSLKCF